MAKVSKSKKELKVLVPHVDVGEQLGEGGNAIVYAGKHPSFGSVAVKFMLNVDTKRYRRFCDEVKVVTGRLAGSARVIPIIEASLTDPTVSIPYYVMPQAVPLKKVLTGVAWSAKLVALAELAEGLSEIHKANVAHRDIKPENIFFFEGTYRFGDFGIASFPENSGVTEENEPMGPWAFMANEMLSDPTTADAFKADVYSFAKTIWAVLTDEKVPFSGQYSAAGREALHFCADARDTVIEPLETLLRDCTRSSPSDRPTADEIAARLRQALALQEDGRVANAVQWSAAEEDAFLNNTPLRAEWTTVEGIAKVMSMLSRRKGLNHFFFPEGGGHQIDNAEVCEGGTMLGLNIPYFCQYMVSPARLTLERFAGLPGLSYAVLEVQACEPLTPGGLPTSAPSELLLKLSDFDYLLDIESNDDDEGADDSAIFSAVRCERRIKAGVCVIAPTQGLFNAIDDYMGTGQSLGREGLRKYFESVSSQLSAPPKIESVQLRPIVRLLSKAQERVEFKLKYLDGSKLTELLRLDDGLVVERQKDSGVSAHKMTRTLLGTPTELEVKRNHYQKTFLTEEIAELFSLMIVGRGDVLPQDMASRTSDELKGHLEPGYVFGKMGNGYLRKAITRFGLSVELPSIAAFPTATP